MPQSPRSRNKKVTFHRFAANHLFRGKSFMATIQLPPGFQEFLKFFADAYNANRRSRSAFEITETELNVIAALAIAGLSKMPKNGYKIPAASGTPTTL